MKMLPLNVQKKKAGADNLHPHEGAML